MFNKFFNLKNSKTILFGLAGVAALYFLLSGNKSSERNNNSVTNSVIDPTPNNAVKDTQLGDLVI